MYLQSSGTFEDMLSKIVNADIAKDASEGIKR
jgi:hypothetical protein